MRSQHIRLSEVLEPEQIAVVEKAYLRALDFLRQSGDAEGDKNVCERLAMHVITLGREEENLNSLRLTNLAIVRYRAHRAEELVRAAQIRRLHAGKKGPVRGRSL